MNWKRLLAEEAALGGGHRVPLSLVLDTIIFLAFSEVVWLFGLLS